MTHLLFLENQAQVLWTRQSLPLDSKVKLVAVTAEALQSLEECDLPHEPVSAFADTRRLALVDEQFTLYSSALVKEIESFIARRYSPARFDGPGFLSGQGYYIQDAVSAVATRTFLMRETIRVCSPEVVTAFEGDIDKLFLDDGYVRNPWLYVAEELAKEYRFHLEFLPCPTPSPGTSQGPKSKFQSVSGSLQRFSRRVHRYARRTISRLIPDPSLKSMGLDGLRLLMVDSLGYDWRLVLEALQSIRGVECFTIDGLRLNKREWTYYYAPTMRHLWNRAKYELETGPPQVDETEVEVVSGLFDEWLGQQPALPEVDVLGVNLLPALTTHLRMVTSWSPALGRHADAIATRALEIARPNAVCFFSMPWLAAKRLAYQCRQRRVPVVCYQHGGVYGTHSSPKGEQNESAHADYFLTYGMGIRPRADAAFPLRARFVPVGSARVEQMMSELSAPSSKVSRVIRVLWIAEISIRNTIGNSYVEDTERYALQKQCLGILNSSDDLRVIYRPYKHQVSWDGTTPWIQHSRLRSVRTNATRPLGELIRSADIVISDNSSGTVWNEVVALKRPLILYCDPCQTSLSLHFMSDLERSCYWCKSKEGLVAAVHRLAREGMAFVAELGRIDTTDFMRRYVLHRDDGRCVQRVVSFLDEVRRNGQSADDWGDSAGTLPRA